MACPTLRDDPVGRRKIRDRGPGHEFEIGRQAVWGRGLAESRKAIGEAIQIGIVGGDQDVPGAEPRAGLEKRGECGDLGFRPERDHFQIRNRDAGRIEPGEGLLQGRFVVHQRIGKPARHRRQTAGCRRGHSRRPRRPRPTRAARVRGRSARRARMSALFKICDAGIEREHALIHFRHRRRRQRYRAPFRPLRAARHEATPRQAPR